MKKKKTLQLGQIGLFVKSCCVALIIAAGTRDASAVAYGTINNFDAVNDTGNVCHGFEIQLEDCRSVDVTYCYSYNHYGTPTITDDTTSNPGHTNCIVRYEAVYSNGVWSAYTAIPTAPIAPTLGHSFTNPGTNFGGEHFGVGYYGNPTNVLYNWLQDNGAGQLVLGPSVQVSTPVFAFNAPAAGGPGQVQAAMPAPEPEFEPAEGFGPASWIKSIKTVAHTNAPMALRDLVSDDPAFPNAKSWRNGEQSEVESEFELLQQEFGASNGGGGAGGNRGGSNKPGGGGGGGGAGGIEITNAAEDLTNNDDVITRRYEFYAYVGPTDPITHEALDKKVAADGIHGVGIYSNIVVVGDFLAARMSAYNNVLPIGLTEDIADGAIDTPYPARSIVIAGVPFTCTNSGTLPTGMNFDTNSGQLSGTPTQSGIYTFKVRVTDTNNVSAEHAYTFAVLGANQVMPAHSTVDTVAYPLDSGDTTGLGLYTNGDSCTVTATARPGYRFSYWSEDDQPVSSNVVYQFPVDLNHSLVANFVAGPPDVHFTSFGGGSHTLSWPNTSAACVLEETTNLTTWGPVNAVTNVVGTNITVTLPTQPGSRFYRLRLQ